MSGKQWVSTRPNLSGDEKLRSQQMRNLKQAVMDFIREEEGLTIVEYAVAGGLITAAVAAAFTDLGEQVLIRIEQLVTAVTGVP
jgi:pilus assembly protein Flp/PilA